MKIRINDLARELEVKSKAILDVLVEAGVTSKKTHSSSLEDDEAEKVRKHFASKSCASAREKTPAPEVKPKLDPSKSSKPGAVLRLREEKEKTHEQPAPPAQHATDR